MSIRTPLIISLLIVAAMLALSAWAWQQVPDTARIAVHFDINGTANGFAGKARALFILPAVSLGITLLLAAIPFVEPRRLNLASSMKLYRAAWIGGLVIVAVSHAMIVLRAAGVALPVPKLVMPAVALLFIVIGNYLGKTRSNFFAGVRTPWTLSSEYSWEMTHRLTGRLFMLAGGATLIASVVTTDKVTRTVMLAGVLGSALAGTVASYFYWRRDPARHSGDRVPE